MTWQPISYALQTALSVSSRADQRTLVLTPWVLRTVRFLHTPKEETGRQVYSRGREGLIYTSALLHHWMRAPRTKLSVDTRRRVCHTAFMVWEPSPRDERPLGLSLVKTKSHSVWLEDWRLTIYRHRRTYPAEVCVLSHGTPVLTWRCAAPARKGRSRVAL